MKVLYSLKWKKCIKKPLVMREFRRLRNLAAVGISPKPEKITQVKLDVMFRGKRCKGQPFAIIMEHIDYPEKAWTDYANGQAYDWDALPDYQHTPQSFLAMQKNIKNKMKEIGIKSDSSLKLGDVLYSCKKKRWFLCDCM